VVAAGISESLVATAAGIIVAVVALLFYNYLQTRVNHIATDFRLKMEEVADILFTNRSQGK
jgi:biopolymer transport protein ExbB